MRKKILAAVLCAGLLLLSGCAKQDTPKEPAQLQAGYLDVSALSEHDTFNEELAGNYEMADENAEAPVNELLHYRTEDGKAYLFDRTGRLRRYSSVTEDSTPADAEQSHTDEEYRAIRDTVLSSYLADYADFTEITSEFNSDNKTYNLAMEHKIADGIADYALIRLDAAGELYDLSISYADADGDCAGQNFVTDDDKVYFEEQVKPYLTALQDYSAEVTYISYKHLNGKVYAFYEVTYTDGATGIEAGSKRVIFVQ